MEKLRLKKGVPGFTLLELLVAMAIASIMFLAVGNVLKLVVSAARSSIGTTHSMGTGGSVIDILQRDFASMPAVNSFVDTSGNPMADAPHGGQRSFRFSLFGHDTDGDGLDDIVCYRYFPPTMGAVPVQGYIGRWVYANSAAVAVYGVGNVLNAGCSPALTDWARLTAPETDVVNFEFKYCRPDAVKNSHKVVCVDYTRDIQNKCGSSNPLLMWMVGANFQSTHKLYSSTGASSKEFGANGGQASYKAFAMRIQGMFLNGMGDFKVPNPNCPFAWETPARPSGCPDAFDVLGRVCACDCTKDGVDDDGDLLTDEECQIGIDNDGDGNSQTLCE